MAHFYGILHGSGEQVTRLGTKDSGIDAIVKSYDYLIQVKLYFDPETGEDAHKVLVKNMKTGEWKTLSLGPLNKVIKNGKRSLS